MWGQYMADGRSVAQRPCVRPKDVLGVGAEGVAPAA